MILDENAVKVFIDGYPIDRINSDGRNSDENKGN